MAIKIEYLRTVDSHGEIYVEGGVTAQTMNAGAGTYDKITAFTTDGNSSGFVVNDAANDRIKILRSASVEVSLTLSLLGAASAEDFEFAIYKGPIGGTALVNGTKVKRFFSAGGTDVGSIASVSMMDVAANDVIELWGTCTTTGSKNITIVHGRLVVEVV